MKEGSCRVVANQELAATYFRLTFEKPFSSFQPGQFCMVHVPGLEETLLRRPFSLCQERADQAEIVYKAVGPTTQAMARLKTGDRLSVLGPLGQGLAWEGFQKVIGVAGGYGIAPMLGLGRSLQEIGVDYQVYYGARSKNDLLLLDDFKQEGISVHISTEDGSAGLKGRVTERLQQDRNKVVGGKTLWFACGPHGLLQAAAELATSWKVACSTSVEEYMGCGIGVCLGCVIKTTEGRYIRSCVEGPVMESQKIQW